MESYRSTTAQVNLLAIKYLSCYNFRMKKQILFVVLLSFFAIPAVYSDGEMYAYLSGLYSYELGEENIHNFGVGTEFYFDFFLHNIGINYKRGNSDNKINFFYNFFPMALPVFHVGALLNGPMLGIGTNLSYNMSQNTFGIAPQIDSVYFILWTVFKINITYRYNIYFGADNSHEFEFKGSIAFWGI